MKPVIACVFILTLLTSACNLPFMLSPQDIAMQTSTVATATALSWTSTPTITVTLISSPSGTPTITWTPTVTSTSTIILTPTITATPTITPSPTFDFPSVVVNQQAHCRYGPNVAYLHAADLYPGDTGTVRGRFYLSNWLFIKFDKLKYFCWVAPSVVDVTGDIARINFVDPVVLPGPSVLYKAPQNVVATRDGVKVKITWDQVNMTTDDDRGYFLDLFVCQKGNYLWWPVAIPGKGTTSYTVKDDKGCPEPSSGQIYTVEKHGYSSPKNINWPKP
jgi:hypothetical protein